jgi:hypothetical protein
MTDWTSIDMAMSERKPYVSTRSCSGPPGMKSTCA